jgi:hypothetical protein
MREVAALDEGADQVGHVLVVPQIPTVILRSRALARRLEGSATSTGACGHPSRLAVKNGEHLRMTASGAQRN